MKSFLFALLACVLLCKLLWPICSAIGMGLGFEIEKMLVRRFTARPDASRPARPEC